MWYAKDLQALMAGRLGMAQSAQTAGSTSEVNGIAIDRLATTLEDAAGCVAIFQGQCTLASGNTLSIIANFQHSVSSTQSFEDVGTALTTTLVHTASGGASTAQPWSCKMPLIASECRQYIRTQVTPVFSATGTDTCTVQGCVVFYGGKENPLTGLYT